MACKDAHGATRQNTSAASRLFGSATAHPEFARWVLQGCFLQESCSPFVRVMAMQRPAAVTRSAKANRQANSQQLPSVPMGSPLSWAKSQVMQQLLAQAADSTLSPLVAQDWR